MGPLEQPGRLTRMLGSASSGARKALSTAVMGTPGASLTAPAVSATSNPATANSAPPKSSSTPDDGSTLGTPPLSGPGSGYKGIRKRLMQREYLNFDFAQPKVWDAINDLIGQANTDRFSPEGRAQFLAPRMQAYDQMERQALGGALRDQMGRGLDESSYGGAVDGTIRSQFGAARAGAINDLYQAEEQRQLQAQALLRDTLLGLMGRSSQQAASIADNIANWRLQQQQLDQANDFDLNGLISGLTGAAGTYFGMKAAR